MNTKLRLMIDTGMLRAIGWFDPTLPIFCDASNDGDRRTGKNLQQVLGFRTGFLLA